MAASNSFIHRLISFNTIPLEAKDFQKELNRIIVNDYNSAVLTPGVYSIDLCMFINKIIQTDNVVVEIVLIFVVLCFRGTNQLNGHKYNKHNCRLINVPGV